MEEQDKKDIATQYLEKDAEILKENGVVQKNSIEQEQSVSKNRYWRFVGGFFVLLFIGFIGIPFIGKYMQKQEALMQQEQYAASDRAMIELQERLKNDTNGGATAQETLALFTAALKKGDIEQANKYFVIEPKNRQEALINRLKQIKESGKFEAFVGLVEKMKYMPDSSSETLATFMTLNKEGMSDLSFEITKGKYSTVWKIHGLMF